MCVCQNEQQNTCIAAEPSVTEAHSTAAVSSACASAETLHEMDVDDLLKYINGDNDNNKAQDKMSTRKAAKRARQKQRKVSALAVFYWSRVFFVILFIFSVLSFCRFDGHLVCKIKSFDRILSS